MHLPNILRAYSVPTCERTQGVLTKLCPGMGDRGKQAVWRPAHFKCQNLNCHLPCQSACSYLVRVFWHSGTPKPRISLDSSLPPVSLALEGGQLRLAVRSSYCSDPSPYYSSLGLNFELFSDFHSLWSPIQSVLAGSLDPVMTKILYQGRPSQRG